VGDDIGSAAHAFHELLDLEQHLIDRSSQPVERVARVNQHPARQIAAGASIVP
jgi:hypothetical protein